MNEEESTPLQRYKPARACLERSSHSLGMASRSFMMIAVYNTNQHPRKRRRGFGYRSLLLAALLTFCAVQVRLR